MSITNDDLRKRIHDLNFEPMLVFGLTADLLEEELEGQNAKVLDPSQPLPFLIENDVTLVAAALESVFANTMRQYPVVAQTEEDLFLHLSDVDMVGIFATPGEAKINFVLSKAEVLDRARPIPGSLTRKLTIPKHTSVTVNGLIFTMQYPVNLIVKPHGDIEVVYDLADPSPLQTLTGNQVEWSVLKSRSEIVEQLTNEFLFLTLPMKQMHLVSHRMVSSPTSILKKTFTFEHQFLYARAYRQVAGNGWVAINTTHSDLTYDPATPTLKLKVIGQQLTVELPYIYQMTSMASATIRLDIYTTLGEIYMDLASIPSAQFVADFKDLDNTGNFIYSAPFGTMEVVTPLSTDVASGGRSAPTFLERRERMLNNAIGPSVPPLSHDQLAAALDALGFDIYMSRDDVLKRIFIVSRALPDHVSGLVTAPIDSAVMTAKMTLEAVLERETAIANAQRITILPSTLYQATAGTLRMLSDDQRVALESLEGDEMVNAATNAGYLYTPLHYVLDTNDHQFDIRPYFLTQPNLGFAGYSDSNPTITVFVQSASNRTIEYDDTGYTLLVTTESNDPYKDLDDSQCFVQLAFTPQVERELVYVNGTFMGRTENDERIFSFRVDTRWDIDPDHELTTTNFTMRVNEPQLHKTRLSETFTFLWGVVDYYNDGLLDSDIDALLGRHLLPASARGVYQESAMIQFGQELTGLWSIGRPMVGPIEYERYEFDIPKRYPSNVYVLDPVTGFPLVEEIEGKKQLVIEHAKGTPVLDPVTGEPEILFPAGSVKLDASESPIPLGGRTVERWWDIVLFDAQYRFATRAQDVDYTNAVPQVLSEWINDTLSFLKEQALDQTEFLFQPRNTLRHVPALLDGGVQATVYTAQNLVVDLYLTAEAYRRLDARPSMEAAVTTAVNAALQDTVISVLQLQDDIAEQLGDDLVTTEVTGLSQDARVITLLDPTTRLTVARRLDVESDGTLSIKNGVTINFHRHGVSS